MLVLEFMFANSDEPLTKVSQNRLTHVTKVSQTWLTHGIVIDKSIPKVTKVSQTWLTHGIVVDKSIPKVTKVSQTWLTHGTVVAKPFFHRLVDPSPCLPEKGKQVDGDLVRSSLVFNHLARKLRTRRGGARWFSILRDRFQASERGFRRASNWGCSGHSAAGRKARPD